MSHSDCQYGDISLNRPRNHKGFPKKGGQITAFLAFGRSQYWSADLAQLITSREVNPDWTVVRWKIYRREFDNMDRCIQPRGLLQREEGVFP